MYRIREGGCNKNSMVTDVIGAVDENNRVSITWTWPKLVELEFCIVFVLEENLSLEEILRRGINGTIYKEEFGVEHTMELTKPCQMFRIFAAKRLSDGKFEVVNQTSGNSSAFFYRRVRLTYHMEYPKDSFFSHKKLAVLRISGFSELHEKYIMYRCKGGSRANLVYPLDVKKFSAQQSFTILLEKGEEVVLELTENQKKYITIA